MTAEETGAPPEGSPEYGGFCKELELHKLQEDTGLLLRRRPSTKQKEGFEETESFCVVLPPRFHSYALTAYHDRVGHLGLKKCFPLLARRYYWGGVEEMRNALRTHINECWVCRRTKISRHRVGEGTVMENGEWPFDIASGDYFFAGRKSKLCTDEERTEDDPEDGDATAGNGSDGEAEASDDKAGDEAPRYFDGTVTFADQFTRLIVSAAVKGKPTARMIANLLIKEVIRVYGTPRRFRSDLGSEFVAKTIKVLYEAFGIQMELGSAYHHSTVGLVERWHSCLKALLLSHRVASGQDDWHRYLPLMELIFNSTVNTALGYSPWFLNHMFHPRLPSDALVQSALKRIPKNLPDWVKEGLQRLDVVFDKVGLTLRTNALHQKRVYDLKRDVVAEHFPGDRVLLVKGLFIDGNLPKADEPTEATPFTVVRRLPNNNYLLAGPQSRKIKHPIHTSRIVPYPSRRSIPEAELNAMWPVKRVSGRRIVTVPNADGTSTRRVEYRLQWIGLGKQYPYWYPFEYLHNIAELVADYNSTAPPLPPELAPPAVEYEARDIDTEAPVVASEEARARKHFRARAAPQSVLTPGSIPDPFPIGSRVEIFHKNVDVYWGGDGSDAWLPATVVGSRIFRPRDTRVRPERRVEVTYDCDPSTPKQRYETRPGPLVRALTSSAPPADTVTAPASEQPAPMVRQSPRLVGNAAVVDAGNEARWIECRHHGAVLVKGSAHTLPHWHHRCHDAECREAALRFHEELRAALPTSHFVEAFQARRPAGRLL